MIYLSYALVFLFGAFFALIYKDDDEGFTKPKRFAALIIIAFMLIGIYSWVYYLGEWLK